MTKKTTPTNPKPTSLHPLKSFFASLDFANITFKSLAWFWAHPIHSALGWPHFFLTLSFVLFLSLSLSLYPIFLYRVFHVKWQMTKRCVFSSRNARKYLKIVSWSSLIAIFCGLNKNISNHTTEVLYCMLFPVKIAKIHGFATKNLIFNTTISFRVKY